jgi:hypothetical protein
VGIFASDSELYFDCDLRSEHVSLLTASVQNVEDREWWICFVAAATLPDGVYRNNWTKVQYGCEVNREVRDGPLTGELASQPLSRKNFK